jgi:hypothetical protein
VKKAVNWALRQIGKKNLISEQARDRSSRTDQASKYQAGSLDRLGRAPGTKEPKGLSSPQNK